MSKSFSGYEFERNPFEAAEKVRQFSQSICYDALQLAITRNEIASMYNTLDVVDMNIIVYAEHRSRPEVTAVGQGQ